MNPRHKRAHPIPIKACIINPAANANAKLPLFIARAQKTDHSASVAQHIATNCVVGPCFGIKGCNRVLKVL